MTCQAVFVIQFLAMKFTVFAVMAAITWNLAQGPKQSPAAHKKAVTQQAQPNPSPVTVVIDNAQRGEPAQAAKPESPSGDTSPEWALVIVGIVTFLVIGWQSLETRRSADAVKESVPHQKTAADAAFLNAQALINFERPWVMIQIERIPNKAGKATPTFLAKVFNYGKGPAHVTECSKVTIDFCRNPKIDLPIPPIYTPQDNWRRRFLAPKDSFPLEIINPWDEDVKAKKYNLAFGDQPINLMEFVLVAYGKIEYSDGMSNKTYSTAFCFMHENVRFSEMGGYLIPDGPS